MSGQLMQWLAVGLGAAIGACLRSSLSSINPIHAWIPLGTLSANIMGGFLIGIAMVIFLKFGAGWHPNIKLFVVTGFLGGLTTFSTFSSEVFSLLNVGRLIEATTLISLHVALTLVATIIGYYLTSFVYNALT